MNLDSSHTFFTLVHFLFVFLQRLIVEFSLENKMALSTQEKRLERNKVSLSWNMFIVGIDVEA